MILPNTPSQTIRKRFQLGFFLLFVLAPPLDLFRFDLTLNHFIVLGIPWTLGIDALIAGEITATEAFFNLLIRGFLPLVLAVVGFIWIARRFGPKQIPKPASADCVDLSLVGTKEESIPRCCGQASVDRADRFVAEHQQRLFMLHVDAVDVVAVSRPGDLF